MSKRPALKHLPWHWLLAGVLAVLLGYTTCAEEIVLFLKSGDRISGTILSENSDHVTVSNSWNPEISVPLAQVIRRETVNNTALTLGTNATTRLANIHSNSAAGIPLATARTNRWKGEAQVGLNFRYGAIDQQLYYGRFKLGYERPYHSDPKKNFRNGFDYSVEYGKTASVPSSGGTNKETVVSSDRMYGADKTAFDISREWYAYNLAGAGYDHVKKIDFQYEAGPGMGYHLFARTNFSANMETGVNYQAQYRKDEADTEDFYYRFAQDLTWKIVDRFNFAERFEFFPRWELSDYRIRFEGTISYEILRNLSLNLTMLDLYDTQPASRISNNDLQIRSALGVRF